MTSERVQAGSPTLSEEAQRLSEFEYHLAMVMFYYGYKALL